MARFFGLSRPRSHAMSRFLSRRTFLGISASALGAACLPSGVRAGPRGDFPGFSLGIQSYSLRGYSAMDAIQHAADLGFKHMEFYPGHFPLDAANEQIEERKKTMASLGMAMLGHGVNGFGGDHQA